MHKPVPPCVAAAHEVDLGRRVVTDDPTLAEGVVLVRGTHKRPLARVALGDPDGGGWRLVARSRDVSDQNLGTVRIQDRALSVSSSLGSAWEISDETVSHIIDPRTGSAIDKLVEAIVISDRAVLADGWSTALLVAGANRAATRMAERSNLEASISESSGREMSTEGWEDFLSAGE